MNKTSQKTSQHTSQKTKWVWITGASSGMGYDLATKYIDAGHHVIVTARSLDKLQKLKAIAPERVHVVRCDVSERGAEEPLSQQLSAITPQLDCVILNAGNCEYVDVTEFEADMFDRVAQVNYIGVARCLQAALPLLMEAENKPHLVAISSASVYFGLPRAEAYGGSKAALSYMFESLALDLVRHNIDVSVVYPGFVDTPLTRRNDFPMPTIVSSEQACDIIYKGIEKRKSKVAFPKSLIFSLWALSKLPRALQLRIGQTFVKQGAH